MLLASHQSSDYPATRKFRIKHIGLLLIALGLTILGTRAGAQVTSLTLNSDSGDYVGQGQFSFFTPADGTFSANQNYDQGVSLSFNTPNYGQWWYLDFAAPN